MKKLLLITFLAIYGTSIAQEVETKRIIPKGTWSIGGNLSFVSDKTEDFIDSQDNIYLKRFEFSVLPKAGYTVANDLTVGLGLGINYAEVENNYSEEKTTKNIGYIINPFIRKNFGVSKNLSLFLQGEGKYSLNKYKDSDSNSYDNLTNTFFIGLRPGLNYFISNKIALEATVGVLGYTYSSFEREAMDNYERKYNRFDFDLSTSNINLGVLIFL